MSETKSDGKRDALILTAYILVWLLGLVGLTLLYFLSPVGAGVRAWFIPLGAAWSAIVFIFYVLVGDGSPAYDANFAKYRSIWVSFALVVLTIVSVTSLSYAQIGERIAALRGPVTLLGETIRLGDEAQQSLRAEADPAAYWTDIKSWVDEGLVAAASLNRALRESPPDMDKVRQDLQYLQSNALQARVLAELIYDLTAGLTQGERQLLPEEKARGTTFEPLLVIVTELYTTTQQLESITAELGDAMTAANVGAEQGTPLLQAKARELINAYYRAEALTKGAAIAIDATEVDRFAPFVWITVLYVAFLLFPWILLFLFLLQKRANLVEEKRKALERLDIVKKADDISELAFKNSEYVVSLLLLTLITATIWYFFFYPHAFTGLADLISKGGSVTAFSEYLVENATPITFGFLGAYYFVIWLLLRRYFAGDLNPKAYIYAIVRMLTVFIIGVVFQLAHTQVGWSLLITSVIMFTVGIFPQSGIRWLARLANSLAEGLNAPEYFDRYPLTTLDGLNTWHEVRLLEEKVENVQNLASATLEELVIRTNFSPMQLLDWVDQALLFIHARERWYDAFRSVGIRTATDLLDNTLTVVPSGTYDPAAVDSLALAINTAQICPASEMERPREEAWLAGAKLHRSVGAVAGAAQQAHELAATLEAGNPETLDAIVALQEGLNRLVTSTTAISVQRVKDIGDALNRLPKTGDPLATPVQEAVGEIEDSALALSAAVDASEKEVAKLDRAAPDTLAALPEARDGLDAICAEAANLGAQVDAAFEISKQGAAGTTNQDEWTQLLLDLNVAREAAEETLKDAQLVRKNHAALDKDRPETLNRVIELKSRLDLLNEKSLDAGSKAAAAKEALEGLPASEPLIASARTALDAFGEVSTKMVALAVDARDAAAPLDVDSKSTMAGLTKTKSLLVQAHDQAKDVKARGQAAAMAIQAASAPPHMSKEILQEMVMTLRRDPNVVSLARFWSE